MRDGGVCYSGSEKDREGSGSGTFVGRLVSLTVVMTKYLSVRRVLLAFGFLIIVVAASLLAYAHVIKSRASLLLRDTQSLRPGISTAADARRVIDKHRGELRDEKCTAEGCKYYFSIENRWLALARVEPLAQFDVTISLANGTVQGLSVWLSRSMPIYPTFHASAGLISEYVEIPEAYADRGSHYAFPTPVGKPYLRLALDSHATAEQRQHAYAFDLRCLVKPGGGCDLPCDYLPEAWQDWKASLVGNGFTLSDFDEHYPNNKRCDRFQRE